MRWSLPLTLVPALAMLTLATSATAEPITLRFSGHVTTIGAPVGSAFGADMPFRYTLTYDSDWHDRISNPNIGDFFFSAATSPDVFHWTALVGDYEYARSGTTDIRTRTIDTGGTGPRSGLTVDTSLFAPSASGDVITIGDRLWYVTALDLSFQFPGSLLDSDHLYATWPDVPWTGSFSLFLSTNPNCNCSHTMVSGTVDVFGVPSPATLPLMGVGLASAWLVRRKHHRTRRAS